METSCEYLTYQQTGSFSPIVIDYLQQDEKLAPFYEHPVSIEGIRAAIAQRKAYNTNRQLLVSCLRHQYKDLELSATQEANLEALLHDNCFTICTAHQPNIFTGHLYFIYKILHAIKLADKLKEEFPNEAFVPVYYMGSEDADLDELGHITIDGKSYKWNTSQTGAVGRMKVDKTFIDLMNEMEGQLSVLPHGQEVVGLFRQCYQLGISIQQATLLLVHELFKSFGLLVLVPDNAELKRSFNYVVKRELLESFSHPLVEAASASLGQHYKVQASGRDINLFYLQDGSRERIEKAGDAYHVVNTKQHFTKDELLAEVDAHPERFSANVILRGVFQEMILPNIAFIGGGGELAYWLELKSVFQSAAVPFPMLVLRNSLLLVNEKQEATAAKLGFQLKDLFISLHELMNTLVKREEGVVLTLDEQVNAMAAVYKEVGTVASKVDSTLSAHVQALQTRHQKSLHQLEKKMLRAEKRKHETEQRQLAKLRAQLFPNNALQERVDNFSYYYSFYGKEWLQQLYNASLSLEQEFAIVRFPA